MNASAIPGWTASGVLPPFTPASPASTDRSPYEVAITDLILRFDTTAERHDILTGLLDFRAALHELGLVQGFQWLDGSFLENIEITESRPPRDIDVVTFFHIPEGRDQAGLLRANPSLFNRQETKTRHHVDAYFVQLNDRAPEPLVRSATYWYSLWSHRRIGEWKGFLQIDLSSDHDHVAKALLSKHGNPGGPS